MICSTPSNPATTFLILLCASLEAGLLPIQSLLNLKSPPGARKQKSFLASSSSMNWWKLWIMSRLLYLVLPLRLCLSSSGVGMGSWVW